jgi:hypothetical protein
MHTLDDLRQIADLVLCEKCRPLYVAQIEPTVKAMLSEFFPNFMNEEADTSERKQLTEDIHLITKAEGAARSSVVQIGLFRSGW